MAGRRVGAYVAMALIAWVVGVCVSWGFLTSLLGERLSALLIAAGSQWVVDIPLLCQTVISIVLFRRAARTGAVGGLAGIAGRVSTPMMVWPQDVDFMNHLTNSKYNQKLGRARIHFLEATGLLATMRKLKVKFGLGGVAIRFRREIRPAQRFRVETGVGSWDARSIYMEHRFIADGGAFVNAYAVSKYTFRKGSTVSPQDVIRALDAEFAKSGRSDAVIEAYSQFENTSSAQLKAERKAAPGGGSN